MEMVKGKGQIVLLLTAPSQGPAVPKTTPEKNSPVMERDTELTNAISRLWDTPWQGHSGPGGRKQGNYQG